MPLSDTDQESEELYFAKLRELGIQGRFERTLSFFAYSRKMIYAGLKLRHPEATDEDIRQRFCLETLGPELCQKYLQFDSSR